MNQFLRYVRKQHAFAAPWDASTPVREELFSAERLEQHAGSLALVQEVTNTPPKVVSLTKRLNDNAKTLLAVYRESASALSGGRDIVPAAAWLLDNYHLIEAQTREIRSDLPPGYYRQLPKLAKGPFAGYPRVFGIAWAFVAHTDSHVDIDTLQTFIAAYQRVQPLTIGELWAVAITLRIVLIENLRRLAEQIINEQTVRDEADALAAKWLKPTNKRTAPDLNTFITEAGTLNLQTGLLAEQFTAQLAKRLRGLDPRSSPLAGWLEEQLSHQGETIDEVVQHAQQRQGAANVTVRNIITSMRFISSIDWAEVFESVSLVDATLRQQSAFDSLDFTTRNQYRCAVEQLSRGSQHAELAVAEAALTLSQHAEASTGDPAEAARKRDPGYFLIGSGREALEHTIGFSPSPAQRLRRSLLFHGIDSYIWMMSVVTLSLMAMAGGLLLALPIPLSELPLPWLLLLGVFGLFPIIEVATLIVNRLIISCIGAQPLPSLDLSKGVPTRLRTLIAVPTLLTSEEDLREQVERLEVHHLSSGEGALAYALLIDGVDAHLAELPGEAAMLSAAQGWIDALNERYSLGAPPGSPHAGSSDQRFFLLRRRRIFNHSEHTWMGWERKRGKLHELNRLLRGAEDTTFIDPPALPKDVRYVITLDADTRLPRGAASRLVGKMAHPLNQPRMDAQQRRVVEGYAILQPRVTPSLPTGGEGSIYQRLFSAPGGIDPYAATISDLYQDLLGEGSFAGKGIYDVDAFQTSLAGRVPENTLLSHDLFEGIYARAGLASDIEVIEDFPARYDVAAKRQHRWTRGDWQLLPWLAGPDMPLTGRLKMVGNLRRSLIPPLLLASLAVSWQLPFMMALASTLLLLAVVGAPVLLSLAISLVPSQARSTLRHHYHLWLDELKLGAVQMLLLVIFLPDQAWRMLDAIAKTLTRIFYTHRHLLEWVSAAQSMKSPPLTVAGFYQHMAPGTLLGLMVALSALWSADDTWLIALPLALLWLTAPAVAAWLSSHKSAVVQPTISEDEALELRLIARRTWRYFETFVTSADNGLPPDNFQEDPAPALAQRTSPTNMGLYLLSTLAARDFGWLGTQQALKRLETTLETMHGLPRYRGHFYNWYTTYDLRPLDPRYVSTVDSGNLAGHLIVIANACETLQTNALLTDPRDGIADTLKLARDALKNAATLPEKSAVLLSDQLEAIDALLTGETVTSAWLTNLSILTNKALRLLRATIKGQPDPRCEDVLFWVEALNKTVTQHIEDRAVQPGEEEQQLTSRLQQLANAARRLAVGMDFGFLLNTERQLLSIGYSLDDHCLDISCYDLLASEARLASLFAIAKGDIPTRHWLRLGRPATPLAFGSALISWSGSMFEYLMPSLVMRAPGGSLLEQTNRLVVKRQETYASQLSAPWGISESAYNARDFEFTYQYSNFGVPGLGLKRGLSADLVIAPYATGLATMVDPNGACRNFKRLEEMDALGRYGFYEALDFTRSRLPAGEDVVIVRSFMAHHQGMTIVAIANTLHHGQMRARFHREPMIQASELLLQERVPRNVDIVHPRAEEVKSTASQSINEAQTIRHASTLANAPPITHLLSNGCYSIMLTATGGGYSRWRNIAISRWQPDATRDHLGSFIFLRDTALPGVWTATGQGATINPHDDSNHVVFAEDYARYTHRHGDITTHMEVLVSGEDDSEVRHVSITNSSRHARDIDITSYLELVLTTTGADNAHPAFAKMFVVTEYLDEFNALIATRRRRAPDDEPVWAAHFAVVEGETIGEPQYETDRARFLGRGHATLHASSLASGQRLSGTVGSVLDPVFALRYCLRVAPGKAARIAYWTVVASSREALMDLIDKHHDRSAFERAKTLAWTQAQVQLRHLGIQPEEAADFQRFATPILYPDPRFRAPCEAIERGAGPQSRLWQHGISGDLPIIIMRIDTVDDIAQVRQLLRAHEYWRMKRLCVDVVIINERGSSYVQDLQHAIDTAVLSSQTQPRFRNARALGSVFTLRADLMSLEMRTQLQSIARVALKAHRGSMANQLALTLPAKATAPQRPIFLKLPRLRVKTATDTSLSPLPTLEFFNGLGGFAQNGREYVTILEAGTSTPAPWINIVANSGFGFQVSAEGAGYLWADNSRENQLTPWSNDPVADPSGDVIYVRDEESLTLFTATAHPIQTQGRYIARHGFGYTQFEHQTDGIALTLLHFVPLDAPLRISRLRIRNHSGRPRKLSVTAYTEWVLGTSRSGSAPFLISRFDTDSGALLVENPWNITFPGKVAFLDIGDQPDSWTADRCEFIGYGGSLASPAGLRSKAPLAGTQGAGLDPCAALNRRVSLAVGESIDIVVLMGQGGSTAEAQALIARYRETDIDAELAKVNAHWQTQLNAIHVTTPDRAMDIMLNGWLLYQTIACRITARSGFYQASGAYGFRDQLQDGMALSFTNPEATREHLLRAASRQFVEGDVQHWWLPHSGQGVRTRISDDRVWLAYACAHYIATSHDAAVLDEPVSFLEGAQLAPGEHDCFFQPMVAEETASLFEHCARGLDQSLSLFGEHGLPLIGGGDWNDGMNRVGEAGKGESVWLGWLLVHTLELFLPFAERREAQTPTAINQASADNPEASRAERWRACATRLRIALESNAWDGQWYRRATFDDGSWLGSHESDACQIDSIAQTWAVLSGAAEPHRAALAMGSLEQELIRHDQQLALLFWPPFDQPQRDPGYIGGYPPGMRENGGQYSHAAMWAILAFAKLGEGSKAHDLFALLNPINHARTEEETARYHVEPYVVAADVYSVAPHTGRGGWTWYTGSASWMYRAGIEGILGIRREGSWLIITPCLPSEWPGFSATLTVAETHYAVKVITTDDALSAQLNGSVLTLQQGEVRIPLDGKHHQLEVFVQRHVDVVKHDRKHHR